tara:strand:+ start:569 stop:955 length:387 start_codon:yes stop_codon:yes gene_type:complete
VILLDKDRLLVEKILKVLVAAVITCSFSGCASVTNLNKTAGPIEAEGVENDPNTTPTDDSPYARSPRRQIGQGFSLDFFGSNKKDGDDPSQLAIDDPEYAEYLQWKRWQEFKAYQEWKVQQAGAKNAS